MLCVGKGIEEHHSSLGVREVVFHLIEETIPEKVIPNMGPEACVLEFTGHSGRKGSPSRSLVAQESKV